MFATVGEFEKHLRECDGAGLGEDVEWEAYRDNHRLGSHVGVEAIANRELTMDDLFT